ncbi:MAG: hypothetical protein ACE5GB_01385 [Acidimicrobiales bacterium]
MHGEKVAAPEFRTQLEAVQHAWPRAGLHRRLLELVGHVTIHFPSS